MLRGPGLSHSCYELLFVVIKKYRVIPAVVILENEKTLGTRLASMAMAEVPNSRSVPSGHDEQFINPPGEDLHCIICFLPSKEPVLTRCDHKFCGQCLEEYILDFLY